jgi:hypothetical protein
MPKRASHCCACHLTFGGVRAFDMHQRLVDGRVVCRTPEEAGLVVTRTFGDGGVVYGRPGPEVRPEAWSKPGR